MNNSTKIPDYYFLHYGIPIPEREYKFLPDRKFRIDFFWQNVKLAVEIEGGAWSYGRHTRGAGFTGDMEKYNLMVEQGIYLLRYEPKRIDYEQIKRVYEQLKAKG